MVGIRALQQNPETYGSDGELRRCVRDLVALSSLPALWVKANPSQIAESVGLLAVSILDADFACVFLHDPLLETVHCHQRSNERSIDLADIRERYRPNSLFEIEDSDLGRLRAMCVPIGREAGSGLVALSRRPNFPTDTEQTLMRLRPIRPLLPSSGRCLRQGLQSRLARWNS